MSLVICSNAGEVNKDSYGRSINSIFEPYSWRNDLSSTLTIPKNAQVGLHSAKIELDGMLVLGNVAFFQYFGEVLNESTETTMEKSSGWTMEVVVEDKVKRTPEQLAKVIELQMNEHIWHPNLVGMVSVAAKRDGTTNQWVGFDITYDQDPGTATHIPGAGQVWDANWMGTDNDDPEAREAFPGGDLAALGWSYSVVGSEGRFTCEGTDVADRGDWCSMIAAEYPISLMEGQLLVDLTDALAKGNDFIVGLSRVCANSGSLSHYEDEGLFAPTYYDAERGPDVYQAELYSDYSILVTGGKVRLLGVRANSDDTFDPGTDTDSTFQSEVEYWLNANTATEMKVGALPYDISTNTSAITDVRFTCDGQQVKVEMLQADGTAFVLYQYDSSYTKEQVLPPISQATWSLCPLLAMEMTAAQNTLVTLTIRDFTPSQKVNGTVGYQPFAGGEDAGWWGYQGSFLGEEFRCQEIETRGWNDLQYTDALTYMSLPRSGTNRRLGKGTTGDSKFQNLLFVDDSDLYDETFPFGQISEKLGFAESPVSTFTEIGTANDSFAIKFSSDTAPTLYGSKSLFVKVGGLSQQTTNAFKGTPSTIIAHMPMFDGQASTGRFFYEPNEIAYIDLKNAYEFKVSSLDIAFCYIDESFATPLTGQSVVLLHIRQKS